MSELDILVHTIWCDILGLPNLPGGADFFVYGGNSLMLMRLLEAYRVSGLVNEEKPVTVSSLFGQTTIADHAKVLQLPSVNVAWNDRYMKDQWQSLHVNEAIASSAQQRIWLDEQVRFSMSESPAMYNIPLAVTVGRSNERVSVARLRQALLAVIRKHKVLRTRIQHQVTSKRGIIKQYVNDMAQQVQDEIFTDQLCYTDEQVRLALVDQTTQQFFSLDNGRVVHCHVLRRYSSLDDEHLAAGDVIILNIHHVAFDGASRMLLFRDIQLAYEDECGFLATTNDNEFQYIDYSIYEAGLLADSSPISFMNKAREYWISSLKDCINKRLFPATTIPANKIDINRFGGNLSFTLTSDLSATVRSFAASQNMTLFQLFMACYQLFLHKLTRGSDICVGGVSANRYRAEVQQLIGMFVNILPYRTIIDTTQETTVQEFLVGARLLCLDVLHHGHLPFQDIVQLHRDPEQSNPLPFFQTTFAFESFNPDSIICSFNGVPCTSMELPMSVAKYDLSLLVIHDTAHNHITCKWEYSTQLFDEASINIFSDRFISVLNQVVDKQNQQQPISSLYMLQSFEQKLLQTLNETHVDFVDGYESCIAALFDAHSHQDPTRTCVVLDDTRLTYAQMSDYSNQLAKYLVNKCGVQPGDIVMQCVQRSIDMVIGVLGILKARATYCPLNPDHPSDRHAVLIDDMQARFILCHDSTYPAFAWTATHKRALTIINISTSLLQCLATKPQMSAQPPNNPYDRAYIIFTSGSTGKPKAVPVLHCNFLACIRACQHLKIFGSRKEIVLQASQCSYDVHVFELLGCMVTGGTLVMLKPLGHLDMDYVSRTIAEQRVTWTILTPTVTALLVQFLEDNPDSVNRLQSLRTCGSAGE